MLRILPTLFIAILLSCANSNGQPELKKKNSQTTEILNFLADDKLMGEEPGNQGIMRPLNILPIN